METIKIEELEFHLPPTSFKVLQFVKVNEGLSSAEIALRFEKEVSGINKILKYLRDKDFLEVVRYGKKNFKYYYRTDLQ